MLMSLCCFLLRTIFLRFWSSNQNYQHWRWLSTLTRSHPKASSCWRSGVEHRESISKNFQNVLYSFRLPCTSQPLFSWGLWQSQSYWTSAGLSWFSCVGLLYFGLYFSSSFRDGILPMCFRGLRITQRASSWSIKIWLLQHLVSSMVCRFPTPHVYYPIFRWPTFTGCVTKKISADYV